jgi:hypothetical protein
MRWRQDILQDITKVESWVELSNLVGAESVSSYKMPETLRKPCYRETVLAVEIASADARRCTVQS